eukprot:TRINITY_DN64430_c0_g1_i1.p1 TRINITY_DN64430_c0_g1~~TRINITY_DN64430_c0_g1_i1.p1  ORF type:complete len:100 (+),score=5.53 TRINITY_DN64430_c0_g1_i1:233-532(+)
MAQSQVRPITCSGSDEASPQVHAGGASNASERSRERDDFGDPQLATRMPRCWQYSSNANGTASYRTNSCAGAGGSALRCCDWRCLKDLPSHQIMSRVRA